MNWQSAAPYNGTGISESRDRAPVHVDLIDPMQWYGKPIPERRWIVPGWIPRGYVTILGGDGGLGKSLLAMQLMNAVATGQRWLGLDVEPCKAFGMFCEDLPEELHIRQAAINRHYDQDFADLTDIQYLSRVSADATLVEFDQYGGCKATDLFGTLMNQCLGFGAQLVVLDSLHDIFSGNENYRGQVRRFVAELRALATEIDGAVVVTAHPSLAGRNSGTGESGSTAWNNSVRSRLYLKRPEDEDSDVRILKRMKSNYAAADAEVHLRWSDGVFEVEGGDTGLLGSIKRKSAEQVFLECLDVLTKSGMEVNDAKQGNYAPRVMARLPEARVYKIRDLERAMTSLLRNGELALEAYGPPSRNKRRLVRGKQPNFGV